MQCGNLIGVSDTKEAWSYVSDVVQIIETKAKVSVITTFFPCTLLNWSPTSHLPLFFSFVYVRSLINIQVYFIVIILSSKYMYYF